MYPLVFAAGAWALYFAVTAGQKPRSAKILAAVLWGIYSVYEYYVANGTLCDANCNIRADLVLFLPLLGIATYLAFKREPASGAVTILALVCLGVVALLSMTLGYTAVAVIAGVGALIAVVFGVKARVSGRRA